jgi:putative chitinase
MIAITEAQIRKLAPQAISEYLDAFRNGEEVLTRFGINKNARRVAHFMAQVLHECGLLKIREESMNYDFNGLTSTFGRHRITLERAREICRVQGRAADQEAIANTVYGGAWGKKNLGNTDPGDGWRYRGRGLIQITGREMYADRGKPLGIDLIKQPDLVFDPRHALPIAAAYWKVRGCNELADKSDNARAVTKAVNGGDIGLAEREKLLEKTKKIWPWT